MRARSASRVVDPLDAHLLGEGVVEGRDLLGLQGLERRLHRGGLAAQRRVAVVVPERLLELHRLPHLGAGQLLEVPLAHRARADLDGDVLGLRAREGLALDGALVVDDRPVARLRLEPAFDRHELGERLLQARELGRDHLVGHLGRLAGHGEAPVVLGLEVGLHLHTGRVAERLPLGDSLGDRDAGGRHHRQVLGLDGLGEGLRHDALGDVALHLRPKLALEDLARRLAGAEPLELHPAGEAHVGALQLLGDALGVHLDGDLALDGRHRLDLDLHVASTFGWKPVKGRYLLRAPPVLVKRRVGGEGLEPSRLAALDPKSSASASSATRPSCWGGRVRLAPPRPPARSGTG